MKKIVMDGEEGGGMSRRTPEHRLISAVLLSVLDDYRGTHREGGALSGVRHNREAKREEFRARCREEALAFMSQPASTEEEPFSYLWCCRELSLDAAVVRRLVIDGSYNTDLADRARFCLTGDNLWYGGNDAQRIKRQKRRWGDPTFRAKKIAACKDWRRRRALSGGMDARHDTTPSA